MCSGAKKRLFWLEISGCLWLRYKMTSTRARQPYVAYLPRFTFYDHLGTIPRPKEPGSNGLRQCVVPAPGPDSELYSHHSRYFLSTTAVLGLEKVDFQLVLSLRASSPPLGEGAEQETGLQQTPTSSAPLNDAEITRSSFEKHDSLHGDSTTHLPFHVFIALPSGCTSSYHHNHIFVRYSHASISWFIAAGT